MDQPEENWDRHPTYAQSILTKVLLHKHFKDLMIKDLIPVPEFRTLLTPMELERLQLDRTPTEKREELREIITRRWTIDDFKVFLGALQENHSHIREALDDQLRKEQFLFPILPPPQEPNLKPLPSDSYPYAATVRDDVPQRASQTYSHLQESFQTFPKELFGASAQAELPRYSHGDKYSMDSLPRGFALVINNEKFTYQSDRKGSCKDKERLASLFKCLGFLVNFQTNLKAAEMLQVLHTFAKDRRLKEVSAIIVVIMTHGMEHDILFGTDGKVYKTGPAAGTFITRNEVQKIFNSSNCPLMKGKPKGFFLQACRGEDEDSQKQPTTETGNRLLHSDTGTDGIGQSTLRNMQLGNKGPDTADFIFVFPSTSGYKAYRQPEEGSLFIQSLTKLIEEHASHLHFEDILKKQRQEFREALSNEAYMMPESSTTLDKAWYFNPPR